MPTASAEVRTQLLAPRPDPSQPEAVVQRIMKGYRTIGSPGFKRSDEELHQLATASVDRSYYPDGFMRQVAAITANGSRVDLLRQILTPTLVIHGREDPLVPVECGIHTAELIRGAKLELIDGMGHDLPPKLSDRIVDLIAEHVKTAMPVRSSQAGSQARSA